MISFIYYNQMSSFIKTDYEILKTLDVVDNVSYKGIKDAPKLFKSIWKGKASYSWFAGGHAALAVLFSKMLGKKSIVVLGGYEVANCPQINYGAALNQKSAFFARFALKYADKVLSVDESLKEEAMVEYGLDGDNIEILPTGYDPEYFKPEEKKEGTVLTVAPTSAYLRKGLDLFFAVARKLPEYKFVVAGKKTSDFQDGFGWIIAPNVKFTGWITDKDLLKYYQRAKVYCQLSYHEGLPNALCEAMLCECVPVGTLRNGIPKAIGDTGYTIKVGDVENTVKAVCLAMISDGKYARERIKERFPLENRRKRLYEIFNKQDF